MKQINSNDVVKKKAKIELESYMKNLRKKVYEKQKDNRNRFDNQVVSIDKRKGIINEEEVDRVVFFLKGTGCSQIEKNGGCTCCGFYSISNLGIKIEDDYYKNKICEIIENKTVDIHNYEIVCLYNDGSLLNEKEFSFNVLIYMIKKLSKIKTIRKIVIEAKVNDITDEKLKQIRECTDKEFEITIGYESSNEDVRQLCVNRPFSNIDFESKVSIANCYNINIVPLLMVKPAFLTEKEAIEDFVQSLEYLEKYSLKRIDMELPTVMKDTLNYELWRLGEYKPVTFWSIIEILRERKNRGFKTPLYISPMVYSVAAVDKAANCSKCSEIIYELFQQYNKTGNINIFNNINCDCKKSWETIISSSNNIKDLGNRVLDTLKRLETKVE